MVSFCLNDTLILCITRFLLGIHLLTMDFIFKTAVLVIFTIVSVELPFAQLNVSSDVQASQLFSTGRSLSERSHYLESLDLLEEARDVLESSGLVSIGLYADVLHEMAKTKIKGRLHQNFPAQYVKTALEDIQLCNRVREKMLDTLPQNLSEGYYLEGYIHKKFFMRMDQAQANFLKALKVDPASVAAKRELSELISNQQPKENK